MNRTLIIDDDATIRTALQVCFARRGWEVRTAPGVQEALSQIRQSSFSLIVCDVRMQDGDGLDLLREVRRLHPETPIIILTAYANVSDAVRAIRYGATDYLVKPLAFEKIWEAAMRHVGTRPAQSGCRIVGSSDSLLEVIARAKQVARSEADILIEAESGAGKEVLARQIHDWSGREGPFVAVNCAAPPENLLESELFGCEKGAFTGATATRPGRFELAEGGTLLLDEIGEMPLALQPKLLRVLQEREVDRLGAAKPIPIRVRVIATTNRSLASLVDQGKFRSDLYYRLNVIPLQIPPLRARPDDIPVLVEHFVRKYGHEHLLAGFEFSGDLMRRMQQYDWPGNIRELENAVRRAIAFGLERASEDLLIGRFGAATRDAAPEPTFEAGVSLRDAERQLLEMTLRATNGNRTRAAEMLGISIRTIRNKIREYGLPARSMA